MSSEKMLHTYPKPSFLLSHCIHLLIHECQRGFSYFLRPRRTEAADSHMKWRELGEGRDGGSGCKQGKGVNMIEKGRGEGFGVVWEVSVERNEGDLET